MPIQNMTIEELDQRMKKDGWIRKDFKSSEHYRGWYFRNLGKIDPSGIWHIDHPLTFWYREKENKK